MSVFVYLHHCRELQIYLSIRLCSQQNISFYSIKKPVDALGSLSIKIFLYFLGYHNSFLQSLIIEIFKPVDDARTVSLLPNSFIKTSSFKAVGNISHSRLKP